MLIGYTSVQDYKKAIQNNLINNCPVTVEDIEMAEKFMDLT